MISKIQKAQARVDKAVPDRYQVVALEGEGKQKKATVLDKEREVQLKIGKALCSKDSNNQISNQTSLI